jgi:type VI secretion system protein ImpH
MAAPSRTENSRLRLQFIEQRLRQAPFSFQFFQAVRMIQLLTSQRPVGFIERPALEAVRFIVRRELEFPAGDIHKLVWADAKQPILCVNFMGLTGPSGVLPVAYSEALIERGDKDDSLESFLNMFNHRMISLFYRAWEKYRFHIPLERGESNDRFSSCLRALIAILPEALHNRLLEKQSGAVVSVYMSGSAAAEETKAPAAERVRGVPDEALLFYAGLLSLKSRPAVALKSLIADYFGVKVEVEQFVGAWYRLGPDSQCRLLGTAQPTEQLGVGSVLGDEIWDQQSRARICIGPLSQERYTEFLPDGRSYVALRALLQMLFGPEIGFDVRLILRREEVPPSQLDDSAPLPLGWLTWLKSVSEFDRSPDDTILALN